MVDINNGERDKELELMISYCLQLYASERDCAFLTQEQEDAMFDEFEFKSYVERKFVQEVFEYADELAEIMEQEMLEDGKTPRYDVDVGKWCINYQDKAIVESIVDKSDKETNANMQQIIPSIVPKKVASIICRKYLKYQRQQGTIFDSQAIPSSKRIKTAMEMFGFNQTKKNIVVGGNRTSIDVFENAVVKEDWIKKLKLEKIMEKIVDEDL